MKSRVRTRLSAPVLPHHSRCAGILSTSGGFLPCCNAAYLKARLTSRRLSNHALHMASAAHGLPAMHHHPFPVRDSDHMIASSARPTPGGNPRSISPASFSRRTPWPALAVPTITARRGLTSPCPGRITLQVASHAWRIKTDRSYDRPVSKFIHQEEPRLRLAIYA